MLPPPPFSSDTSTLARRLAASELEREWPCVRLQSAPEVDPVEAMTVDAPAPEPLADAAKGTVRIGSTESAETCCAYADVGERGLLLASPAMLLV